MARDPDWLQESMDAYAINNKARQTLKFIYPRNVIFPPRKLPDGSFDFGNQYYNEVSNGLKIDYGSGTFTIGVLDYIKLPNSVSIGNEGNKITWQKYHKKQKQR